MKKAITILLTICLLTIGTTAVFAADHPAYLDYNFNAYAAPHAMPFGNDIPSIDAIALPGEEGTFNYSFASASKQYSDFIFSPTTSTTGATIAYKATSASHNVTLKVINVTTSEVVYSTTISALNGFEQEFRLSFTYMERNQGYYIELSSPSISGASGTVTVS